MNDDGGGTGVRFDRDWFRFGLYLAILYAAFTVGVIYLLQIDQSIGLLVAAGASVVFAVGIMIYVVYVKGTVDVSIPDR